MVKWFMTSNLFTFSIAILQIFASIKYLKEGSIKFGLVFILYSLSNFVFWICKGE